MPPPEPVHTRPLPIRLLRQLCLVLLTGALLPAIPTLAGQAVTIERQDPRLFGYQLGDVISQTATIRLAPGYSLDPQSVPRAGKRAGWFMVRGVAARSTPLADGGTQLQLTLEMQLVNSPKATRTLTIPPVALRFKGKETITDTIPSLTIDAVPLGTGDIRTGLPEVAALRPAPVIATSGTERQLALYAGAAAALLAWIGLAWLIRRWKPRALRPFAAAARELRSLVRHADSLEGACHAVQRLHRAFDEVAGHRLFSEGVPGFCRRLGVDAALETRTVAFFATSQTLFFNPGGGRPPADCARELTELCEAWRRFERRHP